MDVRRGWQAAGLSALTLLVATVLGCGARVRPAATMSPAPAPADVTAEIAWLYSSPGRLFVFVGVLRNTTPRTFNPLNLTWTAYDPNGRGFRSAISQMVSPIGPHATHYVVTGDTGRAVSRPVHQVTVSATGSGGEVARPPMVLRGEHVQMTETPPPQGRHGLSYRVSATLTAPADGLNRAYLRTYFLLRDASGAVVGAHWARRESYQAGLPGVLPPGTAMRVEERWVPATSEAATAEVIGYADTGH